MRRYIASFLVLLIVNSLGYSVFGQINCTPANSNFLFTPTPLSQNKFIGWDKFPEFSLPFKIIYNGPRFGDQNRQPLKHGFSHLSSYSGPDSVNLPVKNRALIYYGVAYNFPKPQPWQIIRSPWNNDINGYRAKWRGEMFAYATHFSDTKGSRSPAADLLIIDVERHWEGQFQLATDLSILGIKNDPLVPKEYSQLTDNQFVERYKRDMLKLYTEPLDFMKNDGLLSKFNSISSYGDVPIRYQGLNIEGNQWPDWQTNPSRLSYLMKDTLTNNLGGSFYSQLDFMSPSIYIQADYATNPKARGGNYLAEMLFQIEANKSWTKKDIVPFAWLRYEDFSLPYPRFVKPFQAEAMAIFPFLAGAKGLVLWEDSFVNLETVNFTTYEYFINGLYRLSLYKSFFEENYELVQTQNARDLFLNQLPVWRGVVKDGKILIAAHNPYAGDNEITNMQVAYKNWFTTIQLKGKEVFLCSFDLVNITSNEPSIDP
ncbi:MAG: T9SS C-terminal target domain-containing protein, partial [Bacteroidota bacterium]